MRAYATCRFLWTTVWVLLVSCLYTSQVVSADVGGGSGHPITPYSRPGINIDEDTVMNMKQLSSRTKYIPAIPGSGSAMIQGAEEIGLAYVKSGLITSEVRFAFFGTDENGTKLEVDFSEVRSFKVLRKEGDVLVLEIDQFPVITPRELLSKKPTYTELRDNYGKSVRLWLLLRAMNRAKLYLVGKRKGGEQLPVMPIEDLEPEKEIRLGNKQFEGSLWWAIPSVTSDPTYPFREIMKK